MIQVMLFIPLKKNECYDLNGRCHPLNEFNALKKKYEKETPDINEIKNELKDKCISSNDPQIAVYKIGKKDYVSFNGAAGKKT